VCPICKKEPLSGKTATCVSLSQQKAPNVHLLRGKGSSGRAFGILDRNIQNKRGRQNVVDDLSKLMLKPTEGEKKKGPHRAGPGEANPRPIADNPAKKSGGGVNGTEP
jgi:hypothetical protein